METSLNFCNSTALRSAWEPFRRPESTNKSRAEFEHRFNGKWAKEFDFDGAKEWLPASNRPEWTFVFNCPEDMTLFLLQNFDK